MTPTQTSRRLFLKTAAAAAAGSALPDSAGDWPAPAGMKAVDQGSLAQPMSSCVLSLRQPASAWVGACPWRTEFSRQWYGDCLPELFSASIMSISDAIISGKKSPTTASMSEKRNG